jgi:hypothetical protein
MFFIFFKIQVRYHDVTWEFTGISSKICRLFILRMEFLSTSISDIVVFSFSFSFEFSFSCYLCVSTISLFVFFFSSKDVNIFFFFLFLSKDIWIESNQTRWRLIRIKTLWYDSNKETQDQRKIDTNQSIVIWFTCDTIHGFMNRIKIAWSTRDKGINNKWYDSN